jgi:hypothetical protein
MNRTPLLLGLCAAAIAAMGCDNQSVLVEVAFTDDGTSSIPALDGYVQGPMDDLNFIAVFQPDHIIIPTGIAVPVQITGGYVEVLDSETEADADLGDTRTTAPTDEVLSAVSSDSTILGVEIVNNQDESDTRARWVVYGVEAGFTSLVVEGSDSLGTVTVPAYVIYQ